MLRDKVGIKKMIVANGLMSLIPSVECRDPSCSSEYGIQGIRKSRRRSRDPKRRDERIFHNLERLIGLSESSLLGWFLEVSLIVIIKGTEAPTTDTPTRPDLGSTSPLFISLSVCQSYMVRKRKEVEKKERD